MAEQVKELVSAFKKIWSDSWGVRMEDLMRNSLIALGEADFTLTELPQFLNQRNFRAKVLERVSHPIAIDYFKRFDSMTVRGQIGWIEPVMNKVNAFFSDERIRQMFSSSKSSFDMREAMDNRKILLIKLDKGRLKGSADLLGSLLMAKIQMAAFPRSDMPQNKRVPFYLYVDEFQNFATDSFANILSEARKYRLNLTVAHQYTAQLENKDGSKVRDAVFGNVGTMVIFRVGADDADFLEKEFEPEFMIQDLVNLPNYHIYLKLMIDGVTCRPFSATTLPPIKIDLSKGVRERIIKSSRELYTRSREEVEEAIEKWSSTLQVGDGEYRSEEHTSELQSH